MAIRLPDPIAKYIAAENGNQLELLEQCFAEDAVVRDEGRSIVGVAAIKRWKAETKAKYQHSVEPLACVEENGRAVVSSRLTGNFPGSPITLQFVFGLRDDRIISLEIG
jgi:hypothetical protein